MRRKDGGGVGIESHFVAHVGEVGTAGLDGRDDFQSLGKAEVGEVLGGTQSINYQHLNSLKFKHLIRVDAVGIGDICQRTNAVAQDGEVFVHGLDGDDLAAGSHEGFVARDFVHVGLGETRKLVGSEDIVVVALDGLTGLGIAIELHFAMLHPVESTYVVESRHMIAVGMGDEDGVEVGDMLAQHLLAEVGADIEEDIHAIVGLEEGRSAQVAVARVGGAADLARASNHGYPLRSTRA